MENSKIEITLNDTERCLLDVFNEIQFTPAEKFELLESYIPLLLEYDKSRYKTRFLMLIEFYINHIEFVDILREYAESRRRSQTVGNFMPPIH